MPKLIHRVTTVVRRVWDSTPDVRVLELADPDGWDLPPFAAGSHIDVHLPSGRVRQYSLCGDPDRHDRYTIAVSREMEGRGGSSEIHSDVGVGTILPVSLPRNFFPVSDADHHVLIAGGIGITPFRSMLHELRRSNSSFELHFVTRTPESTPFRKELEPLARDGLVRHYHTRWPSGSRPDLREIVDSAPPGAHLYCCGPASLMEELRLLAGERFEGRLHLEAFGSAMTNETDFQVELARSGRVIDVPRGQSILNALRAADIEIPASCEAGVCLECKTRYLAGQPIHKDLAMKAEDRSDFITPCVSGCAGSRLVLDL